MKNRSFFFGLGTGLITGALLLQLMISGGAAPLTKEQIVRGAERLNLTVIDESAADTSDNASVEETDPGDPSGELTEGSQNTVSPSAPVAVATPSPAVTPSITENPNKVISPKEPSTPVDGQVAVPEVPAHTQGAVAPVTPKVTPNAGISVRIPSGSTLTETANILANAGVIKDTSGFLKAANKRKINTIIQSGSYSFTKDESIESIIDKLITLK